MDSQGRYNGLGRSHGRMRQRQTGSPSFHQALSLLKCEYHLLQDKLPNGRYAKSISKRPLVAFQKSQELTRNEQYPHDSLSQ